MIIEGLSDKDLEILSVIEHNARLSFTEIGEKVGLSRVAVKNRMESMEREGVIRGYETKIHSNSAIPNGIKFFLDLEVYQPDYEYVLEFICKRKSIKEVYTTTGDNHIHAIGYAANTEVVQNFVDELYRQDIGVRRVSLQVVLSTIKNVDGGILYEKYERDIRGEESEDHTGNR